MSDYIFSGLIKCLGCGKNFRGRMQRNIKVYICSGYSKGESDCERMAVKEDDLIDIIRKHFNQDVIDLELIQSIEIENPKITVNYTDGAKSILSPNRYTV